MVYGPSILNCQLHWPLIGQNLELDTGSLKNIASALVTPPLAAVLPDGRLCIVGASSVHQRRVYHPIEGEAQATITGLEKCKFFILGLENLILCIDHKPLLAILGTKQNLADIPNPRLMNVKLKSMMYRFKVKHIKGKDHVIQDTFSRRQDSPINKSNNDKYMSNVLSGYSDTLGPPSWVSPPTIAALVTKAIPSSFNTNAAQDAKDIEEY